MVEEIDAEAIHEALTERLAEHCNPFWVLDLPENLDLETVLQCLDQPFLQHEHRTESYHLGRVAYFIRVLQGGGTLDPVEVDNRCEGMMILPEAVLLDGHHRFAAALLAGIPTIPVSYGGRVDVLEWLVGKTKEPDEDDLDED